MSARARQQPQQQWPSPQDEAWGAQLAWDLVVHHGLSAEAADRVVERARLACAEAGAAAEELFGPAAEHAAEAAREEVPAAERAARDDDGAVPRDRWALLLLGGGLHGLLVAVVLAVGSGWSVGATPAGLALATALAGAWAAVQCGWLERRAGRLRRGWLLAAAGALLAAAGTATCLALADRPAVAELPVLAVAAVSALLLLAGWRLPEGRPEPVREDLAPEEWFARLAGLLRGRHDLPRDEVRRSVEDARRYWRDSGAASPQEEFGTPEAHARALVDGSAAPRRNRARATARFQAALALLWAVLAGLDLADDGAGWSTLPPALLAVLCAHTALRERRRAART